MIPACQAPRGFPPTRASRPPPTGAACSPPRRASRAPRRRSRGRSRPAAAGRGGDAEDEWASPDRAPPSRPDRAPMVARPLADGGLGRRRRGAVDERAAGPRPPAAPGRARASAARTRSRSAPASGSPGLYQAAGLELNGAGRLTTIDADPRPASFASEGFAELGLAERVTVEAGEPGPTLSRVLDRGERLRPRVRRRRPQRPGDGLGVRRDRAANGARGRRRPRRRQPGVGGHDERLAADLAGARVVRGSALGRFALVVLR